GAGGGGGGGEGDGEGGEDEAEPGGHGGVLRERGPCPGWGRCRGTAVWAGSGVGEVAEAVCVLGVRGPVRRVRQESELVGGGAVEAGPVADGEHAGGPARLLVEALGQGEEERARGHQRRPLGAAAACWAWALAATAWTLASAARAARSAGVP